jgi:inorganic pyrophosphatase
MNFWTRLDQLIASHEIIIDRSKGSAHPRFPDMIYPLDYGYLKDTTSGDGHEIDIWKGTLTDSRLVAIVCTVDTKKLDTEVKLLIGCTDDEIAVVDRFHNKDKYMSGIIIRRDSHLD